MASEKDPTTGSELPAVRKGWSFASWWSKLLHPEEAPGQSELSDDLRKEYPADADKVVRFIANVIKRREAIVERLSQFPELNDHGFFMVICLMYADTYRGIGYSPLRLTTLIDMFSTADMSHGTAIRKMHKGVTAGVFVTAPDRKDKRKERYYLHPEMIKLVSEAFSGMMDDVRSGSSPSAT